jgi:hypothetical protein
MTTAGSCVDCKRLSEQFRLAGETLTDVIRSCNSVQPENSRRMEELIGFLNELRHLTGKASSVHRRSHPPNAA